MTKFDVKFIESFVDTLLLVTGKTNSQLLNATTVLYKKKTIRTNLPVLKLLLELLELYIANISGEDMRFIHIANRHIALLRYLIKQEEEEQSDDYWK